MSYEIVSKPDVEVDKRKGFLNHLGFIVVLSAIWIIIVLLRCVLVVLNCISVFAISTALEEIPLSEILLSQGEGSLV
ncbi:MAG: hypothetical protein P8R00_04745 [Candidatus Poseidoniaceae archaeon]|nr:hypothetical protein [Candidatus Poseidoniaceae archaeon]